MVSKQNTSKRRGVLTAFFIQTVLILVIYPIIIATSLIIFTGEINQLRDEIDQCERMPVKSEVMQFGQRSNCSCKSVRRIHDTTDIGTTCCDINTEILKQYVEDVTVEEINRQTTMQEENYVTVNELHMILKGIVHRMNSSESGKIVGSQFLTAAAHVAGTAKGFNIDNHVSSENDMIKVGPWEWRYGISFIKHVQVDGSDLVVLIPGIYYVYSQVYFRYYPGSKETDKVTEYLHYTMLNSTTYPIEPITLMKSGCMQNQDENSHKYYTSFHSGLFHLREGDKVYMKVYLHDDIIELDNRQESTYIGMYRVSNVLE
ncbi:tumor necrosis factor ligand superfamily member 10-like [Glandiceps talaboti]